MKMQGVNVVCTCDGACSTHIGSTFQVRLVLAQTQEPTMAYFLLWTFFSNLGTTISNWCYVYSRFTVVSHFRDFRSLRADCIIH